MRELLYFVIRRLGGKGEHFASGDAPGGDRFSCIDLSVRRPHETAIDVPWDAFCCGVATPESHKITARHWCECDGLGSKLREVDELAERAREAAEKRNHIIEVATNRRELSFDRAEQLGSCCECFVTSKRPTTPAAFEVEVSLQIQSLAEAADYQCHRAWIAHLNRLAAAYRSGSMSSFDRDLTRADYATRSEFDSLATSLLPAEAKYLPVELQNGTEACPAVLRLDLGAGASYSGQLFLAERSIMLRKDMPLVRVASVMCGTRPFSCASTVAIVK